VNQEIAQNLLDLPVIARASAWIQIEDPAPDNTKIPKDVRKNGKKFLNRW
jgi:hypothetical protein